MKGRNNGTPEGAAAAEYVAKQMQGAGLHQAGENGTWFQDLKKNRGRNVIGALPGTSGRWIVIGAHHDGLGERKGKIHNGADDNASGVAVILEIARRLGGQPRLHGLLFCSFDAEEDGLVGSSHFVASKLFPVESFAAMICFDLVGGRFLTERGRRVFALGAESSTTLFDWIGRARQETRSVQVERAGIYAIEPMGPILARSDYSPFRLKKVPFVFFSSGTPWYYHTPHDDVGNLDFQQMSGIVDLVVQLACDLATGAQTPAWREPEPNVAEDARLLLGLYSGIWNSHVMPVGPAADKLAERLGKAVKALGPNGEGGKPAIQNLMVLLFEWETLKNPSH